MTTELRDTSPTPAPPPAAVFNGIIAIPLIWFIDRIAADRNTMGEARSGWLSRTILLLTFLGVAGSVVAMAISYFKG